MATVTVSGVVKDETGRKDSRDWKAFSPVYREGSDGEVLTMRQQTVRVVAGLFSAKLEPGICVIENPDGQRYTVTIPDEDADLWGVIATAVAFPPNTEAEALASAVNAYLDDNQPAADWNGLINIPAAIGAGTTQANARSAIGAASTASVTAAQSAADAAQATASAATVASQKVAAAWAETTDKQAAPTRPALVAIGDSFTQLSFIATAWNGSSFSRTSTWYANSYLTAAMVWNRQPCTVVSVGIGGDVCNNMLSRFDADVASKNPHVVLIEGGTNDIATNRTAAATFSDMRGMYAKAWKFGAKVIATTCPPRNTFTTAQMKEACKLNTMLRNYAATNPQDFALVDMWRALADPATGNYKAGYTDDDVHPNTAACWAVGKECEAAFDRFFPTGTSNLARSNVNDDNLLTNPMFITAGGSIIPGAGVTGSVAQGWTGWSGGLNANTTAVMSLVSRADGLGQWQQINTTVIPNTSTVIQLFQICSSSTFAVGDILQAYVEFETDSAGWTNGKLNMHASCRDADGVTSYSYIGSFGPDSGGSGIIQTRPEQGVLATPPFVVPASTNDIMLTMSVGGLGTVRFGRAAIRKLAA